MPEASERSASSLLDGRGLGRASGEQPVVPDAMEALRQHVQHEAADELRHRQRHGLVAVRTLDAIILVLEGDAGLVGGDEAAVGDSDAVGVARKIGKHSLGPGEWSLRQTFIDDPLQLDSPELVLWLSAAKFFLTYRGKILAPYALFTALFSD